MANETPVAERDSSLVLKMAAGIDEYVFPDCDVLPEICIEGREHAESFVHLPAEKAGQHLAYFLRGMVGIVQFEGDFTCLVAHLVQEYVDFGCVEWAPGAHMFQEFFQIHHAALLKVLMKKGCYRVERYGFTVVV